MPSSEEASFEVVESELALHVLIDTLCSPALLEQVDDVLAREFCRHGSQMKSGGFGLVVAPFGYEPDMLSLGGIDPIIVRRHNTLEGEARREFLATTLAPRAAMKGLAGGELTSADRIAAATIERVETPDGDGWGWAVWDDFAKVFVDKVVDSQSLSDFLCNLTSSV
jgi:hypothetical protein